MKTNETIENKWNNWNNWKQLKTIENTNTINSSLSFTKCTNKSYVTKLIERKKINSPILLLKHGYVLI